MAQEEPPEVAILQGQVDIWRCIFGFVDSLALKCAVEFRIADIINSHDCPITLNKILQGINTPSPDKACLSRIMRLLVRKGIFTMTNSGEDALYGLTNSSKWLLQDRELTLAPMVITGNHPIFLLPWHYLSKCVEEGGIAFQKAHGSELFDFISADAEINKIFNKGMASTAKITVIAILEAYENGFEGIKSLVDVGGGTGTMLRDIIKAHPGIKGINLDLPHAVVTAPEYPNVQHVAGDMFATIPNADAVIIKWILHNWDDDNCVKILKNCREAIPKKTGKVIIVDMVLQPNGEGLFDDTRFAYDLIMAAVTTGGKERTEVEWKKVLENAGFPRYKIIQLPALSSIIEAYPE